MYQGRSPTGRAKGAETRDVSGGTMKRKSRIVAFAAVLTLAGLPLAADPLAAADRRGGGGTPQQGMSDAHQSGPIDAQAKGQADYHADYRARGTQDEPDPHN